LLNVSRQSLNQWLSGAATPSPEITLRLRDMFRTVEAEKTNRGDRASTRPPQKPKKGKSVSSEKPNSGRKEK